VSLASGSRLCLRRRLVANVLQIAEGGDLEAGTFNKEQMMIQGTNFNFSTTPPLLAMCCYTLYYFFCAWANN